MFKKTNEKQTDQALPSEETPEETKKADATLKLQEVFRDHMLEDKDLTDYQLNIVRNNLGESDLSKYKAKDDEQVALIGTSSIRSLLYACKLGTSNKEIIPVVIIIDNSKNVYEFWKGLREYVNEGGKGSDQESFLNNLSDFLDVHLKKSADSRYQAKVFFTNLFNNYGFEYVKSIISATVFIKQRWEDTDTFSKLNTTLDELEIKKRVLYPSNIVSYMNDVANDPRVGRRILENIALLKPELSIHSNLASGERATEVYLCEDQTPRAIEEQLYRQQKLSPFSKPPHVPQEFLPEEGTINSFWELFNAYNKKWHKRTAELDVVSFDQRHAQDNSRSQNRKEEKDLSTTTASPVAYAGLNENTVFRSDSGKRDNDKSHSTTNLFEKMDKNLDKKYKQHPAYKLGKAIHDKKIDDNNLEDIKQLLASFDASEFQPKQFIDSLYLPLHIAAQEGKVAIVELLLQSKLDPNFSNGAMGFKTALSYAAENHQEEVWNLLIKHNADPKEKDNWNKTPEEYRQEAAKTQEQKNRPGH